MSFMELGSQGNRSGKTSSAHLEVVLLDFPGEVATNRFLNTPQGFQLGRSGNRPRDMHFHKQCGWFFCSSPYFEEHCHG